MARGMIPSDIGRIVTTSDPRLAPDGRTVAYVVTAVDLPANEYRSRIWVAACNGASPPTPLTAGTARDRLPRWSPDGSTLAFVSHREDAGSELYALRLAGGEAARLAAWPEEIDDVAWSPDGRWIAFGSRVRDEATYAPTKDRDRPARRVERLSYRYDNVGWTLDRPRGVLVVPADGTAPPRAVVTREDLQAGLAWSADSSSIVFSAAGTDTWDVELTADLFVVDARDETAEPRRITENTGQVYAQPSAKPDGTSIAFVLRRPGRLPCNAQIGITEPTGQGEREPPLLTLDLDRNCAPMLAAAREPVWDGDELWFQAADGGNLSLYRVDTRDPASAKAELMVGGERVVTGFDVSRDVLALCISTPTMPPELVVLDRSTEVERRLTNVTDAFTSTATMLPPERFTARSTAGAEVEAWVIRPADFETGTRYPALVNIHGGPYSSYGSAVHDEFQYQAGAGYVVIYANPRGSDGYGQAWGDAIRGPKCAEDPGSGWGGVDYDDVMAVVDEALRRFDFIDGDRLGVLGGSYGGYLTSWIVGHTDRFRAACSERSVNNQLTMHWTSDIGVPFLRGYTGVSFLEDPDELLRASPITYVENMHTPLLILHSDGDLRCPVEQAEQLFVALRLLGRDVEFVRFPGEGHEMSRSGTPKHRVERAELILDFFGRHLG